MEPWAIAARLSLLIRELGVPFRLLTADRFCDSSARSNPARFFAPFVAGCFVQAAALNTGIASVTPGLLIAGV